LDRYRSADKAEARPDDRHREAVQLKPLILAKAGIQHPGPGIAGTSGRWPPPPIRAGRRAENRAGFRKRGMNPKKNKEKQSLGLPPRVSFMLCGRFFGRCFGAPMHKVLAAALTAACLVNLACLLGHF
jgi:hypothetical protein